VNCLWEIRPAGVACGRYGYEQWALRFPFELAVTVTANCKVAWYREGHIMRAAS
jgi:hypothetical protein